VKRLVQYFAVSTSIDIGIGGPRGNQILYASHVFFSHNWSAQAHQLPVLWLYIASVYPPPPALLKAILEQIIGKRV
jgi:hypothetical protein